MSFFVGIGSGSPCINGNVCLIHLLNAEAPYCLIINFLSSLVDNVGSNFGLDGTLSLLGQEHPPFSSGEQGSKSNCSSSATGATKGPRN